MHYEEGHSWDYTEWDLELWDYFMKAQILPSNNHGSQLSAVVVCTHHTKAEEIFPATVDRSTQFERDRGLGTD